MAELDYRQTFTIDTDDLQELFEPDEWEQLLNHFETPEQIADWVMEGILDSYADDLGRQIEEQAYELQQRLDSENRGERVYF